MIKGAGKRRVAIYVRVSTGKQTTRNQQRELEAVARRHDWTIVEVFKDHGISGTKGREQRPGFDKLLRGVTRKDFDLVMVWSADRLGRSMPHLVQVLEALKAKNVDLYLHQQGIDTSTPQGEGFYYMSGIFAAIERAMIVERIKAGLKRAKAEGTMLGRPRIGADVEARIRDYLAQKVGIHKTAKLVGVGSGTVQRVREEVSRAG
jgi:DNA invertase Pin-like site-specific DNA recombinase